MTETIIISGIRNRYPIARPLVNMVVAVAQCQTSAKPLVTTMLTDIMISVQIGINLSRTGIISFNTLSSMELRDLMTATLSEPARFFQTGEFDWSTKMCWLKWRNRCIRRVSGYPKTLHKGTIYCTWRVWSPWASPVLACSRVPVPGPSVGRTRCPRTHGRRRRSGPCRWSAPSWKRTASKVLPGRMPWWLKYKQHEQLKCLQFSCCHVCRGPTLNTLILQMSVPASLLFKVKLNDIWRLYNVEHQSQFKQTPEQTPTFAQTSHTSP